jgi:DNA polymerase (family 10)
MAKLNAHEIAAVLEEMAAIMEITGENPFKIRAYHNAARVVDGLTNLEQLIAAGELIEVPGIGKNLAEHISELAKKGHFPEYIQVRKSVPGGVLDMLRIPGLGPKKVQVLWKKRHVTSIQELKLLCERNRLSDIAGFGAKTEQKILQGIAFLQKHQDQYLYSDAIAVAAPLLAWLKQHPKVKRAELGGSIRRCKEVVKDIDVVVSSVDPQKVMSDFVKLPGVESVIAHGDTKSSVVLKPGIQVDCRVVSDKEFPYALHHFTGSKEHNVALRTRAKAAGLKISEYGLFREGKGGEKIIPCKDETEFFEKLGLDYIPPEMRENMGEIEAAEKNKLPKIIELKDLTGFFHCHTTMSDGKATLEEMVAGARDRGYHYIGISDHSQSAVYAGGLKFPDLKKQWAAIDALNKKLKGMHIFKGTESDIHADGTLDYSDDVLQHFDFVVASVHGNFNQDVKMATARVCKAISHPACRILGHPTGRLLLAREGVPLDFEQVIDCAVAHDVAIEINANPHRLDMDWRHSFYAHKKGLKIVISPDAHSVSGIDDLKFGVNVARKGWWTKADVINTWPLEKVEKWLRRK